MSRRRLLRFITMEYTYNTEDNHLVIERLRAGDESYFALVYKTYYKAMCAYASHYVEPSVAEEISQDTMLYVWENRDRLIDELSLKGLLFMIVKNKALNSIKHQRVKLRVLKTIEDKYETQFDNPDFYFYGELMQMYESALGNMPEAVRTTFEMSRHKHLTYSEIATELGVSPQTVSYRIVQAIKILRRDMKDYLPIIALLLASNNNNVH